MSRKQVLQNRKGLTVIELLVAMAIFAIVGIVLVNILIAQNISFREQHARNKLIVDSLRILNPLRNYALYAEEILESYTYGTESFLTDDDTILLRLPAIDASNDNIPNKYDVIIFDRANKTIRFIIDPSVESVRSGQDSILISTINDVIIRYNAEVESSATRFSYTLELKEELYANREQRFTQTGSFSIRNLTSL